MLGCASMADLAAALSARHGLPVIDRVAAAVVLVEALGRLGLQSSKQGACAPPQPKSLTGFPDLAWGRSPGGSAGAGPTAREGPLEAMLHRPGMGS